MRRELVATTATRCQFRRPVALGMLVVMRWCLLLLLAACALGHDHRDDRCPGETVRVGERAYCLVTCPGAIEDNVRYPGFDFVDRYDDGIVLAAQRHDTAGHLVKAPSATPAAVCGHLEHGCACTTPACRYWQAVPLPERRKVPEFGVAPRCRGDDPQCGPIAFTHGCVAPARERHVVAGNANGRGPCRNDGECMTTACNYHCTSTEIVDITTPDRCAPAPDVEAQLATAQCGCVDAACAWFTP